MKIAKSVPALRMTAAVAVALAGASLAVPALAETGSVQPTPAATSSPSASSGATAAPTTSPTPGSPATASPSPTSPAAPAPAAAPAPGISEDGLAEATLRDLGMTLEQFNAAGELARRAADALPSLSRLPGYVGISISNGRIIVDGQGAELQARVDALNAAGLTAVFTLAAPAAPAPAPSAADLIAASTDQLFAAYVRDVGPAGLQAVAYAGGHFVIRTGGVTAAEETPAAPATPPPAPAATATPAPTVGATNVPAGTSPALTTAAPGKISPAAFVARYKNVQLEKSAPITTEASTDYFGGQGYVTDVSTICSAGFGAYDPTGLPLILTAGHCAEDGISKTTTVEPPAAATAGGATMPLPTTRDPLGTFGFSQFGGPGNTAITGTQDSPGNIGTDIAVIQGLAAGVTPRPAATIWDNVANPAPSSVKIIGTLAPVQGQAVCHSGRTSGWKCGTVDTVGIMLIPGRTSVAPNYDNDLRAVRAFDSTTVKSAGGDSGGPWISGNFAVGTHTGAETQNGTQLRAIAATLQDAMATVPNVQLQLFLNAPQLDGTASGATLQPGTTIRGRVAAAPASAVAAGSSVRLTRDGGAPTDVPVQSDGTWSFALPATEGKYAYTAATVNGFSHSETTAFALTASALTAPAITTPAAVPTALAPAMIEGTGTPGNTVAVTGAVTGSATVAADGRWSVPFGSGPLYGKLAVSAVQTSPGHEDGPAATAVYLVQPPVPALALSLDGSTFRQDALPKTISGTGVEGASVSVSIDGVPLDAGQAGGPGVGSKAVSGSLALAVLATGGHWSVPFPTGLTTGLHTLTVSQSLDGIASAPLSSTFSISAPVAAAAAAVSPDRSAGTPVLASTGAGGLVPAAGAAAAAFLLGAGMLVLGRRRKPAAQGTAR
ncbi:S1 family peptidase [Arthrobacter sp. NPDC080086]|uniref:S1 family peptidase n=1 Tax=Arthrobacter sp. NPDC080086 TaxID=3155917 RepID=UPI00344C9114